MNPKHKDWHLNFKDKKYLSLSEDRLKGPPLIWCTQFAELIKTNCSKNQHIDINDYGCNVRHFCKAIDSDLLGFDIKYRGFDISGTYLTITKQNFPMHVFEYLDIEDTPPSS